MEPFNCNGRFNCWFFDSVLLLQFFGCEIRLLWLFYLTPVEVITLVVI